MWSNGYPQKFPKDQKELDKCVFVDGIIVVNNKRTLDYMNHGCVVIIGVEQIEVVMRHGLCSTMAS